MKSNKIFKFLKKKAPDILIGAGIGGVITGTVMACKATMHSSEIVEEHKEKLKDINEKKELGMTDITSGIPCEYTEKDYKKDLTVTYLTTAGKFIKLYLPSAAVMVISIGCLLGSHKILNAKVATLTTACASIDTAYKNYRSNVVEKYGEDVDKQMAYNVTPVKAKDGEEKTYKTTEKTHADPYSVIFDRSTSKMWEDADCYNETYIDGAKDWFKNKYNSDRRDIYLNEIKDYLGIERDKFGQLNGIKWDKNVEAKTPFDSHKIIDPVTKECTGYLIEFKNVEFLLNDLPVEA